MSDDGVPDPLILVRLTEQKVAYVTINRPQKLNAFSSALMAEFVAAFEALKGQRVRAVVLTGAGKAFVGGADVKELGALDAGTARAFIERVHGCCEAVRSFPAPVIARINGYALGAGLELAASCDLRVAAESAVFGMPEVRLGIPSVVEAAVLPGLVGWGRTREMLLLGENFGAQDALRMGLVERVAPLGGIDGVVDHWLAQFLACGPQALRIQKALIRRWEDLPLSAAIEAGVDAFASAWSTDEPVRMISDFLGRPK